ncbi:sulfate reduction electron transfer complex DsrMKJOP subunit DsrP [Aureibacter tunicatorum]|uniref:Molybdopterin-containing oxidoreductase family membrane subunit n=1 Tax=Aureibacter tunicatorum TaxID=866807 RepID=A0AAE3XIJ0_9BACT|nr:NrfD/PsrC family molybdoenzyme membrane anchor subunit [Aureibacter tunicatorum]MDR6237065.1 molybdopterin-containing oxidoreductase family membrane subunit [Aureibacter tunicatorum]BDD06057.1 Hdr menaquinol oxidoreductase integral membrane subunit [Aureibacter tunicatorum]
MKVFINLLKDSGRYIVRGTKTYHLWMGTLTFVMLVGALCYGIQIADGLHVTGMTDRVSWGLYISNFTFLVGVAAAAVMLVLPTYILNDVDFKQAVLIGEGMAVAALLMCLAFVVVDIGGPARFWHIIPFIGDFNFPKSLLAWDVLVINGYLLINLTIPLYILIMRYQGKTPNPKIYLPGLIISVFWAVAIHMVTAFLLQGLPARPFWNTGLLGPRFLASAFTAGPALIIIALAMIRKFTDFDIPDKTLRKLGLIITVAAQINLIMLLSELFKEFYFPTHHSESAYYLFFGLEGKHALVPWIRTSIFINVIATVGLFFHKVRNNLRLLYIASGLLFIAIWIEKGFGMIIPGFIPGPWGAIVEYQPTGIEIGVTFGIWAMGAFIFTILARMGIAIELRKIKYKDAEVES